MWQGHDTKSEGTGMNMHYGTNLPVEDILAEQDAKWPEGPIAALLPPTVQAESKLPAEAVRVLEEYLAAKIDATTLALRIADLRTKAPEFLVR